MNRNKNQFKPIIAGFVLCSLKYFSILWAVKNV